MGAFFVFLIFVAILVFKNVLTERQTQGRRRLPPARRRPYGYPGLPPFPSEDWLPREVRPVAADERKAAPIANDERQAEPIAAGAREPVPAAALAPAPTAQSGAAAARTGAVRPAPLWNGNELVRAVVMSEVLGPPLARRKSRPWLPKRRSVGCARRE